MSEVVISIDLPGRRMWFSQDDVITTDDPELVQYQAVMLLEAVYADARAALSVEYVEGDEP